MSSLCILTPDPGYEEDWQKEAAPLAALFDNAVAFRPWNDAGDLSHFALVMPLLAWGYQRDPVAWFNALDCWTAQKIRFANPIDLLRWNTDKAYLFDLEAAGIPVVPSLLAMHLTAEDLAMARAKFGTDQLVIKPTISGGADGTYLVSSGQPIPEPVRNHTMLIQPKMDAILTEGEYSLFVFDGKLSHAILKRPAIGDFRVQEQFGGRDVAVEASEAARALAERALSAAGEIPLYARVDMVRDASGQFCIMELELIEPSLFLHSSPDGGASFACAVRALPSAT
jgi:glutathione synthase/RimK-type ligase-like ATP-grasp enzyme